VRVLVVDDSEKLAGLLARGLRQQGYAVDVATQGQDGLWLATEVPYDAIVLDVVLGQDPTALDGFEICRQLREAERWTPILMLTARDALHDRVRGLDVGADDYLTKPFEFDELSARIRSLIRRGDAGRPAVLDVGDLRLDPSRHEAWRGTEALDLTAKEFALLEFLMRHAGEVVSRTAVIDHVWDAAYESDSNLVDVHVRHLRLKIDVPFDRRSIETVRGVGYRLRDESVG
jgi:two-component system OmpR family response regulator